MAPGRQFPLGKTGGLIEARSSSARFGSTMPAFPLGKTGGLIEASTRAAVMPATLAAVSAG